ncbi:hypothetical protein MANES_11G040505v8 [Manihot esculenta]|uniref:Uncharacterized protein n=1 Tax=Manihot esculenta TaxID=3983 RepID=A0ACB7GST4_MANES|nr:hypothetical protein MANES_11G040505v8 [Manihot esculenta]
MRRTTNYWRELQMKVNRWSSSRKYSSEKSQELSRNVLKKELFFSF